jgi:hypothetical protein
LFFQALEALVEEAFPPLADHLPGHVEACTDLVVAKPCASVQDDLGSYDVAIR